MFLDTIVTFPVSFPSLRNTFLYFLTDWAKFWMKAAESIYAGMWQTRKKKHPNYLWFDTVESEGRRTKQCWIQYIEKNPPVINDDFAYCSTWYFFWGGRGGEGAAAARVLSPHTCNLSAPLTGSLTSLREGGGGRYIVNYINVLPVHSTPPYLSATASCSSSFLSLFYVNILVYSCHFLHALLFYLIFSLICLYVSFSGTLFFFFLC